MTETVQVDTANQASVVQPKPEVIETSPIQAKAQPNIRQELNPEQIAEKIIPHIDKTVTKAVEEQAEKQLKEANQAQEMNQIIAKFTSNFDRFKSEKPEVAEKILQESKAGALREISSLDLPILFDMEYAPEILEMLLENPKMLSYVNQAGLQEKNNILRELHGEVKATKRKPGSKAEGGSKPAHSKAPEPIEKVKESGVSGISTFDDLLKSNENEHIKFREAQMLDKIKQQN